MVEFDSFENIKWNVIKNKIQNAKVVNQNAKKNKYIDISSSFDTETTSTYIYNEKTGEKDIKFAFMYVWQFGIDGYYCYGRTWEQFIELCKRISQYGGLSATKKLVVYIHNLAFEFQFFRKYFNWTNIFATDLRYPIKALTSFGIEFRDSLILSGYSLEKTAENLAHHKIPKMVGDLDYTKIRTKDTKISQRELGYMLNDVRILVAYIDEQREMYGDISKVPLTNTGRVRLLTRENCFGKNHGNYHKYHDDIMKLTITDQHEYEILQNAFAGGFTHANPIYVGKKMHNVGSIDFTSSYPTVMISEMYPMSHAYKQEWKGWTRFRMVNRDCLSIFKATFKNLRPKVYYDNYLSVSKGIKDECKNVVESNGRVFSADQFSIYVTSVDWDVIEQAYEWDDVKITDWIAYYKGYLPKEIIKTILELYKGKTKLKEVKGKEAEYRNLKGRLNSVYGMTVTSIIHDQEEYKNDQWVEVESDKDKSIKNYNKSYNRFLYYAWGVFVTAYARRNLWNGILNVKSDYLYSDTDSIKMKNYKKHLPYVNKYNQEITKKLTATLEYYNKLYPHYFSMNDVKPKNIKGEEKPLGVWDFEGVYKYFKTLGAKRYIFYAYDNKKEKWYLETTIAGLPKETGSAYLMKISSNNIDKVFENFNNEFTVPAEDTGKMIHYYQDDEYTAIIKDYQGHYTKITAPSGVHLAGASFTLSMSKKFERTLENIFRNQFFLARKETTGLENG